MIPLLGLYEKAICFSLEWEAKLELARSSGFSFMELNIDANGDRLPRLYDGSTAAKLRRASERENFPVETLALSANRGYPLGSEDRAVREKGLEIVKRGIAFAHDAGIRLIHLAGYDEHAGKQNANTERLFYESIHICAREAASRGVILSIETMDTPFMGSISRVMDVVRMVDSPYLQCYADIGNLTAAGLDPVKEIQTGGKHIVGVHVKDTTPGVYRDIPFGEGTVDFDLCLGALASIGYNGFFVAETWSHDRESFHECLPQISAFLTGKLEKAYKGA